MAVKYNTVGPAGIVTFNDAAAGVPVKALAVDIKPLQQGSGDPSPDNIRPISGWTGANVTRCGKNMLPISNRARSVGDGITWTNNNDGSWTVDGTATNDAFAPGRTKFMRLGVLAPGTYTVSFQHADGTLTNTIGVRMYKDGIYFRGTNPATFTVPDGNTSDYNFGMRVPSGTSVTNERIYLQFEFGATMSKYEPYTGDTYNIEFPGTVYGGTLNTIAGTLRATWANIASYAGESLPGRWISSMDVYSPGATPKTGAQVVYELATPQTYQLTPTQITTLLGNNNIFADCGDVTVTYRVIDYSPIQSVDGNENIPTPSKYDWTVNDISDADAGRCESGKMHKNRIARKRKLELEWQNVDIATANAVLTAFAPEYVDVTCLDPLANGYVTKRFYSGDQGASAYNVRINAWTVSFNIIEQ